MQRKFIPKNREVATEYSTELKEIVILNQEIISIDPTSGKKYTAYLLRARRTNERSWLIKRRYREFDSLHKQLSKKFTNSSAIPPIPPKKLIGNMNEEFIQKRKKGLQVFIDGLFRNSEFLKTPEVMSFFELERDLKNPMFTLPDNVYARIFGFCSFRELFQIIGRVCSWWRVMLFKSVTKLDMVFINKNVFFGNIPVNIDIIEQVVGVAKNFTESRRVHLDRFYDLNDQRFQAITTSMTNLEHLTITNCGVVVPRLGSFKQLFYANFAYCKYLSSLSFSPLPLSTATTPTNLRYVNLSGTSVEDEGLYLIVRQLSHGLKTLIAQSCTKLKKPVVKSPTLKHLDLKFCTKVRDFKIVGSACLEFLDLSFTKVTDQALQQGLFAQKDVMKSLRELRLSSCLKLQKLQIIDENSLLAKPRSGSALKKEVAMLEDDDEEGFDKLQMLIERHDSDQNNLIGLETLNLSGCTGLDSEDPLALNIQTSTLQNLDLRMAGGYKKKKKGGSNIEGNALLSLVNKNQGLKSLLYNSSDFDFSDLMKELGEEQQQELDKLIE